jgi:hypothetical protein
MLDWSLKTRFNDLILTNRIKGFIRHAKKGKVVQTPVQSLPIGSYGVVIKRKSELEQRIFYPTESLNYKKATFIGWPLVI